MHYKNNHCYVDLRKLNKFDYALKVVNDFVIPTYNDNYSETRLCRASSLSKIFRVKPISIGKIIRSFNNLYDKEYKRLLEMGNYTANHFIKRKINRVHLHNEDGSREIAYTRIKVSDERCPITFYTDTVENSDYTMYIGSTHFVLGNGYHLKNTAKDGQLEKPLWISDFLYHDKSIQSRLEDCGVAIVCGSNILIRELHGRMPLKETIPSKYHDVWDRAYVGEI